jgi:hypothetical protein
MFPYFLGRRGLFGAGSDWFPLILAGRKSERKFGYTALLCCGLFPVVVVVREVIVLNPFSLEVRLCIILFCQVSG